MTAPRVVAFGSLLVACSTGSPKSADGGRVSDAAEPDARIGTSSSALEAGRPGIDAARGDGAGDRGNDAVSEAALPSPDAGCRPECPSGFTCCGGACVNEENDARHCGACGHACDGGSPYCHEGVCAAPACASPCSGGETCCGASCCAPGLLCCDLPTGAEVVAQCAEAEAGTCPSGCPICPYATP